MRLLALGGCGGMGRFAVKTALADPIWEQIVVADRDAERAEAFSARCADSRVRPLALDVTRDAPLREALGAADVVLSAVGPYYRFGVPVLRAAIETRTHYLDLCDDWEPTCDMLALDAEARAAGVTAVIGLGASPGVSNLLAVLAARELERVDVLHTIWGIGDDPAHSSLDELEPGRGGSYGAATEHWVQQLTGTIRVVEGGKLVEAAPLRPVSVAYPGRKPVTCHVVGHPEPVTLVRSHPQLASALNLMDMPAALVAVLRDVARRVDAGEIDVREGAARVDAQLAVGGWRALLSRVGLGVLWEMLRRAPHLPSLCAYAEGERDGRRLRVGVGLTAAPRGGMGGITGIPAALGLGQLVRGEVRRAGVAPPEEALDADRFFEALAPHCRGLPAGETLPVRVVSEPM